MGGPLTQGPRSADQARRIDPSGDQPARAVGLPLHARETRFGTSGLGFGTPSRGGVMHRYRLSTDPPASGSRTPQGLEESSGGGKRVVTSRAAASDDARSVARETPGLAVPPGRTTAVARTEGEGTRVPATPLPCGAWRRGPPQAGRACRGGSLLAFRPHGSQDRARIVRAGDTDTDSRPARNRPGPSFARRNRCCCSRRRAGHWPNS